MKCTGELMEWYSMVGGFAKACQRLTWPLWGKKEIQEGLNTIERFKTLLGTWLTIDIWDVSRSHTQETHDAGGEEENITEYDNSSEGRARLLAMHARVEHHSSMGYTAHSASDITRPSQYGGTQRQSTHRSHRQYSQGSHAASTHNSRPPTSHSFYSHDGASSISPSESISQMGSPSPSSDSPYHQSSHHSPRWSHYSSQFSSRHDGHGGSRPPAVYLVAPASSLSANGMVIIPRWGQAPSVVMWSKSGPGGLCTAPLPRRGAKVEWKLVHD
ncbi:hypothetical protein C8R43DRAFT_958811 [Mycena crocata]|nr:hypothetical protein C8R43DRAFT_958811 [Mycena crocata]